MNEIDKEYILNQLKDGYIDLGRHDEKEIEYLKAIISDYDNLQSKINKINEIAKEIELKPAYLDCKYYELDGFEKIKNVIEEN